MAERVTIVVQGSIARIFSPIEAKEAIKLVPGRKWHPLEKCWIIPTSGIDELEFWLEQDGFEVRVVNRPTGANWADAMFANLPPELSTKVYKALAKVLHPDSGGDLEAMKLLTAAYTKVVK